MERTCISLFLGYACQSQVATLCIHALAVPEEDDALLTLTMESSSRVRSAENYLSVLEALRPASSLFALILEPNLGLIP